LIAHRFITFHIIEEELPETIVCPSYKRP
jgi:hypothetical protein